MDSDNGGCDSCKGDCGSCSGSSSGVYRDDCYDHTLIKRPTDPYPVGTYVRSKSTGEWGEVKRVEYREVFFAPHGEDGRRLLGFLVQYIEHACGACGGKWVDGACSKGCSDE